MLQNAETAGVDVLFDVGKKCGECMEASVAGLMPPDTFHTYAHVPKRPTSKGTLWRETAARAKTMASDKEGVRRWRGRLQGERWPVHLAS